MPGISLSSALAFFGLSKPRRRGLSNRNVAAVEIGYLESRQLLTASLSGGTLTIQAEITTDASGKVSGDQIEIEDSLADRSKITVFQKSTGQREQPLTKGDIRQIVFYGTPQDDTFVNQTDIPCVVYGYAGRDTLQGGSGNDRIYGGKGNDRIIGGFGDDRLFGQKGNDNILGDTELMVTAGGDDFIHGGSGNDTLYDGGGVDTVLGGKGRDTFVMRYSRYYDDGKVDVFSPGGKGELKNESWWARRNREFRLSGHFFEEV
ncbi:MAG: hypothetical protein KDA89_18785 [Planctomycetaceae bacterium]|nr:hypothetical protein [Planctomycetaceae bacterium]